MWNWLKLPSHLSLELICRAFASILAPMSPMAFPLMSNLASVELLPSAFSTMDRSLFSLESARDREVRGWRGTGGRAMCGEEEKRWWQSFSRIQCCFVRIRSLEKRRLLIKHASGDQREFKGLIKAATHEKFNWSSGMLCDLGTTQSFTKCPTMSVCTLEWRCFVWNAKYPVGDSWEPASHKQAEASNQPEKTSVSPVDLCKH